MFPRAQKKPGSFDRGAGRLSRNTAPMPIPGTGGPPVARSDVIELVEGHAMPGHVHLCLSVCAVRFGSA